MSDRSTALFAASLALAVGAVAADHLTSEAPPATLAHEENLNPCAAAAPPPAPGQRNYDDIADSYSGGGAPAPAPAPSPALGPAVENPCSAGAL